MIRSEIPVDFSQFADLAVAKLYLHSFVLSIVSLVGWIVSMELWWITNLQENHYS